jgi:tetratricopeptide (TPR) repeat protein
MVHHPADFHLQYLAGVAALRIPGEMPLRHFNRALYLNPRSAEVHRDAGRALAQLAFPEQALAHFMRALQHGEVLQGAFARDLARLVNVLWERAEPVHQSIWTSACLTGLSAPGLASPACLLAHRLGAWFRSEVLGTVARVDAKSGLALAEALRRSGKVDQALAAFELLYHAGQNSPEVVAALGDLSMTRKDPGAAAFWARQEISRSHRPEAYVRLGRAEWEGGQVELAERTAAEGLVRHPDDVPLVALRVELLIARRAHEPARALLRGRLVGKSIALEEEVRLLGLRLKIEQAEGHRHRAERIQGQLDQLGRLLRSGARGHSVRREEAGDSPRSPSRPGPDAPRPAVPDGGTRP